MSITISDDILASSGLTETELRRELAIALFQADRLTLAQAAKLADQAQLEFQKGLAARRIPIHYGPQELDEDLGNRSADDDTLIVVSDTSPVLNLSAISRLDLLKSLYHEL